MDELNIGRGVAGTLITKCDLELDHKEGRTQFFAVTNGASPDNPKPAPLPPEVEEAAVATTPAPTVSKKKKKKKEVEAEEVEDEEVEDEDEIAQLDAEIVDTRNAIREAAATAGKALGQWATSQALVDSLRGHMTDLASRRLKASE
jgi:hypothetical protein